VIDILFQIFIAITAPLAVLLLGWGYRRIACFVGLLSQVAFFGWFTSTGKYVMFIPTLIYTVVWIMNWKKK
jgi:hypothetical protein